MVGCGVISAGGGGVKAGEYPSGSHKSPLRNEICVSYLITDRYSHFHIGV